MKRLERKWLKTLIGISVTALALWLSFRKLDWEVLKATFIKVNFLWVILAVANTIFTVYALGWRWQILLKPKGKIPLNHLFRLNIISQYTNIIIPARLGEVIRAYLASKQYNISGAYVIGTIAIEKILDFYVFVALWISVPALFAMQKEVRSYKIALFFCFLAACFLVFFVWQPKTFLRWTRPFLRLLPKNLGKRIADFFERGIEAFVLFRNTKKLFFIIFLTFFFIGSQVLTNFFLFKALDLRLSFWVGLFVLLAIQAGNIPPSVPGKIGVFEYATILALSLFGITKGQALSYGITLHIVAFLPKIILGLIFVINLKAGFKINDLKVRIIQEKNKIWGRSS